MLISPLEWALNKFILKQLNCPVQDSFELLVKEIRMALTSLSPEKVSSQAFLPQNNST